MAGRMNALISRHTALEKKLGELMKMPVPDSLEVTRVKMEKLRIRDEMEALRHSENARRQCQRRGEGRAAPVEIMTKQTTTDDRSVSMSAALAAATASAVSVFGTAALMPSV